MRRARIIASLAFALAACSDAPPRAEDRPPPPRGNDRVTLNERTVEGGAGMRMTADIWVDNWFALSVNGAPLIEDSVPFRTERSFNAERVTFAATLPATLAFELRDFREDDTGLEYISTRRQQLGDGGAIVQVRNAASGAVLGASDARWRCLVVNRAPLDLACADEADPKVGVAPCTAEIDTAPDGWTEPGFDDSTWPAATEHTVRAVSPKDGYDAITWTPEARLIWGPDLKRDNTVLCRGVIGGG